MHSPRGTFSIVLPKGVFKKPKPNGKTYWYYGPGRNTALAAKPVSLPFEPGHSEFHLALNRLIGESLKTFAEVAQSFMTVVLPARVARGEITKSSMNMLCSNLRYACKKFGPHRAIDVTPKHVEALVHRLADQKSKANNLIAALSTLSTWGLKEEHFTKSLVVGVARYDTSDSGHRPWTPAQQEAAQRLTGSMRRVYYLARYTGLRGGDVIRLGETFLSRDGKCFHIRPQKNGKWKKDIFVAIDPILGTEMETWEREPGQYVRTEATGVNMAKRTLDDYWEKAVAKIPELAGATLHGLRTTRVIELRRMGFAYWQIGDQVGMSEKQVERYCRFADRESESEATVIALAEHRQNKTAGKTA
jgi:integrase